MQRYVTFLPPYSSPFPLVSNRICVFAAALEAFSDYLPIFDQVNRRIIVDAESHPEKQPLHKVGNPIVLSSGSLIQQNPLVYAVPSGGHIQLPADRGTDTNNHTARIMAPPYPPVPAGGRPCGDYLNHGQYPRGFPPDVNAMIPKTKHKKRGDYSGGLPDPSPMATLGYPIGTQPFTVRNRRNAVSNPGTLTETDLLICSPKVRGFCLQDKAWRIFDVDCIDDVDWDIHAFDSLVLPEGYKDLILAFVDSQLKKGDSFDDVINGKGKSGP
jgi:hypothetical protein